MLNPSLTTAVTTIAGPGFIALAATRFLVVGVNRGFQVCSLVVTIIGNHWKTTSTYFTCTKCVFTRIAPYILTIIVLAAFFGKSRCT